MTNREWLNTLSNEEFADWCVSSDTGYYDKNLGKWITIGLPHHLQTEKFRWNDSFGGVLDWLGQEHKE